MGENITQTFPIKGMHCKSCVDRIEQSIKSIEGVKEIKFSLMDENAMVTFDPQYVDIDTIKKAVVSLGYSLGVDSTGAPVKPADQRNSNENSISASVSQNDKNVSLLETITYGIIPHIGCIAFILGSILGVTFLTSLFKPLLLNPFFFHILVLISIGFATVSSALYLHRNGLLSWAGARKKWKYLATMYGTTIGVNLLLFLFIFPMLANVPSAQQPATTAAIVNAQNTGSVPVQQPSSIYLEVSIPCPGHAPLITSEVKKLGGILNVRFDFPNKFYIEYNSKITNKEQILGLEVFKTYPAKVISEKSSVSAGQGTSSALGSSCCGGGCSYCSGKLN